MFIDVNVILEGKVDLADGVRIGANCVNNWGYFILLAWMPLYFKQVMGLELAKSSYFSALPWAPTARRWSWPQPGLGWGVGPGGSGGGIPQVPLKSCKSSPGASADLRGTSAHLRAPQRTSARRRRGRLFDIF